MVDYGYHNSSPSHSHGYLMPHVENSIAQLKPTSIFDLGCGNGSFANLLSQRFDVLGIDASESGILQAKQAYPDLKLEVGSAYDDLAAKYGRVDAVISLEVVEHLYDPRCYARRMFDLVRPGGGIIVSTPYHSYIKNVALALSGRMDDHFTALWDGGHIKFWSVKTLTTLLVEAGFTNINFQFAGRFPALAKSMIATAQRPE